MLIWLFWLVWLLLPAAAAAPDAARWVGDVRIGARPAEVVALLERTGATRIDQRDFRDPGAFAVGLLGPPGLLAQLNRAGAEPPFFARLPEAGPRFVVAEGPQGRASYAFVDDRLWAVALALDAGAVAPMADPFERDRLEPLRSALDAICPARTTTARDAYGNPMAWESSGCSGGRLAARYDPLDVDATVQVVVFAR
jgi:hypothetical protein